MPDKAGRYVKGEGGRPKGAKNKLTRTVRDVVLETFNDLQNDPQANISTWAKKNPTEFYRIAAKLIPTSLSAELSGENNSGHFEITLKL